MYTVYLHTSKTTEKKYVGITCQEPWTKRFNGDGSGYKNCIHFWNAIQKYGWNDFSHEIITVCETEKEAMALERYYIAKYKTNDDQYGYNIKEGGEHQHHPEEVKKHIKEALAGKSVRGTGWKHDEETKRKIKEAQKGRPLTKKHAENCRIATRKYYETHSPSHTFTDENHKNAKLAWQVKILVKETGQTFNSMTECANYYGVLISNLSRAIKQGRQYKGYHFEKLCSEKPNDQA